MGKFARTEQLLHCCLTKRYIFIDCGFLMKLFFLDVTKNTWIARNCLKCCASILGHLIEEYYFLPRIDSTTNSTDFGFSIELLTIFQIGTHKTGISKMHIWFINGTNTNTTSLPFYLKTYDLLIQTHIISLYPMSSGLQHTINIQTNNHWLELLSIIPSRNLYRRSLFL